jgi:predicted RNase H-like nuclease
MLSQQDRVRFAGGLRWAQDVQEQLHSFKGKVNDGGRIKQAEAETEKDHDDHVVCFLMAAWWFLRNEDTVADMVLPDRLKGSRDYEPADYY